MTRKDYIAIAAAIAATNSRIMYGLKSSAYADRGLREQEQLRGVRRAAAHLADFLKRDNPKGFDPALFLTNCGYGSTSMNPSDPALDLRPLPEWDGETY